MKWLQREAAFVAKAGFEPVPDGALADAPIRPASQARAGPLGFGALLVFALLWFVVMAAIRPLMLPDEGRYASIAWEMVRSGEWLTPMLDGLPFFHKPPLFYWITAAAMTVLGPTDLASRVAPLLGAWIAAAACFLFVRRWWSAFAARVVFFGLLLQPLFALGGQFANLDMLVAGCITATILLLAHAVLSIERGRPWRVALAGAYAGAAFGVLAKGLIGLVLPALVVGAWLVATRRWRATVALLWWPGVLAFVCIAAPWFVAMQMRYPAFGDYFFVVQHVRRFAAGGFNNAQPFWFFPAVLLAVTAAWLPWLRGQFALGPYAEPGRGDLRLLMMIWAAVVTVFFSLPQSKLIGYILPVIPPLAVLAAGRAAESGRALAGGMRWSWNAAGVTGVLLSTVVVVALTLHPVASSREIAAVLRAERVGGEPVFMLEAFDFDVPVYARLPMPVRIVDAWADPAIGLHDNWRKELVDAARFARARANEVLIEPEGFAAALCQAPVSWVIGPSTAAVRYPELQAVRSVVTVRGTTLWRVDTTTPAVARVLGCPASRTP